MFLVKKLQNFTKFHDLNCCATSVPSLQGGQGVVLPLTTDCAPPFRFTQNTVFEHHAMTTDNNGTRNNNVQRQFSFEAGMWKRKQWKWLIFCGSGSTLIKEDGSGSKLGSESIKNDLEAGAIFFKSGASGFSNWLQRLG